MVSSSSSEYCLVSVNSSLLEALKRAEDLVGDLLNQSERCVFGIISSQISGSKLHKERKGKAGSVICRYPSPDKTSHKEEPSAMAGFFIDCAGLGPVEGFDPDISQ